MTLLRPGHGAAVLAAALALPQAAVANAPPGPPAGSAELTATVQDFGPGRGTLTAATLDLRSITPTGNWSLAPTLAHRSGEPVALGAALGWQRQWSPLIASESGVFVGQAGGPFAALTLAQALIGRIARHTTFTAALRWSRYAGSQDVWFASGEVRRYLRRGSLAYRLTWVRPRDHAGYTSHLLAFTLNDGSGRGRTQLWLSQGQASLASATVPDGFRGHDRAVQLRRLQPLAPRLALSVMGGLASYDLPGGAVQSRNLGLGLSLEF